MRSFTTTGPIVPDEHYSIPPLERMDLDYILRLIRGKKYFILHAPRQTGKTSALLALANLLNGGSLGSYRCLYINVESAQIAHEDVASAVTAVVDEIAMSGHDNLADESIEEICTAVLARVCHFRTHDRGKPAFSGHFRQFDHMRVCVRPLLSSTL